MVDSISTQAPASSAATVAVAVAAASSSAAAAAAQAYADYVASRQVVDQIHAGYFAAGILGIIAIFSICHWCRLVLGKRDGAVRKMLMSTSRSIRSVTLRKIPGFKTTGHGIIYVIYIIINLTLAFVNVTWTDRTTNDWAKRMGWVTMANLALVTFLALKNTPLAFLTAYSYDRLNVLHRLAGYTVVGSMIIHASSALTAFYELNLVYALALRVQLMGPAAGISLLIMLTTGVFVRKWRYEAFYVIHITFFMFILIALSLHRPGLTMHGLAAILFIASMWVLDRIIRASRLLYYSFGSSATIYPLPRGGIKVTLNRSLKRAIPGAHAFVWIPSVRATETHPFTVVSNNPLQFVIKARNGFTRELLAHATKNPGAKVKASFEGPYSALPNFASFNQVMLIAGGSGASFTFAIGLDLARKLNPEAKKVIRFILVVREPENLKWYSNELSELQSSPLINLTIHVTHSHHHSDRNLSLPEKAPGHIAPSSNAIILNTTIPLEQSFNVEKSTSTAHLESIEATSADSSTSSIPTSLTLLPGRPDLAVLISGAAERTAAINEQLMVAACGPRSMMGEVRETVRRELGFGRDVALHLEQFDW